MTTRFLLQFRWSSKRGFAVQMHNLYDGSLCYCHKLEGLLYTQPQTCWPMRMKVVEVVVTVLMLIARVGINPRSAL